MIFTSGTASFMSPGARPVAITEVKNGANKFTKSVRMPIKARNLRKISALKSDFLFDFVKFGKKALAKAPSPKIRRNKFGILNAMKNISL